MTGRLLPLFLLLLSCAAVQAQNGPEPCPPPKTREELRTVPELRAQGGELGTIFRIEHLRACVPVYDPATQSWFAQPEMLRTYVYADPARPSNEWSWDFPGPTLRVRRTDPEKGIQGDRLTVYLTNNLSADLGGVCSPVCPAGTLCPGDPGAVQGFPKPQDCGGSNRDVRCCCYTQGNRKFPACLHGDNTTNLHFHGSHVSPQAPQDYVLLELRPRRNHVYPAYDRGRGAVAHGDYRYRLDPFPATQAEGTHWYHPHKQGSISMQAANGMPGALIVEGPFDDALRSLYGGKLTEKILFLQQIQGDSSLFNPAAAAPAFLVNGQPQPKITLRPGEVQRWRFVNAALREAPLRIRFPEGIEARQIAMDGIQFAPENYERQPLFPAREIALSPGNRADFLVRAPESPASLSVLADGSPLLFFVEIAGEPVRGQKLPAKAQFPKMPGFLADIPESEAARTSELAFGTTFGPDDPRSAFLVNGTQLDPSCINLTAELNTAAAWKIRNASALAHPFHIHTNPFQVIEVFDPASGPASGRIRKLDPPYVWQDTIALPPGTAANPGWVHLRQRYLDFTGESVLECLLHGDRGMMLAMQTVCRDKPDSFGRPRPNEPECAPDNFIPAAPVCPPAPARP